MVTRIKIALPTAFPYQAGFAMLTGQIAKLPPQPTGLLPQTEPSGFTLKPELPRYQRHRKPRRRRAAELRFQAPGE